MEKLVLVRHSAVHALCRRSADNVNDGSARRRDRTCVLTHEDRGVQLDRAGSCAEPDPNLSLLRDVRLSFTLVLHGDEAGGGEGKSRTRRHVNDGSTP